LPLVQAWMVVNPDHIFMQDNAPAHRALETRQFITDAGIQLLNWPPYSPDLNPIEHVWNWMKSYIQAHSPEDQTQDQLNRAIYEAWDAVPEEFLASLTLSMAQRVMDCIRNNEGPTGY
jgi:hypothetical protein